MLRRDTTVLKVSFVLFVCLIPAVTSAISGGLLAGEFNEATALVESNHAPHLVRVGSSGDGGQVLGEPSKCGNIKPDLLQMHAGIDVHEVRSI